MAQSWRMDAHVNKFFPLDSSIKLRFHNNAHLVSGNERVWLFNIVFLLRGDLGHSSLSDLCFDPTWHNCCVPAAPHVCLIHHVASIPTGSSSGTVSCTPRFYLFGFVISGPYWLFPFLWQDGSMRLRSSPRLTCEWQVSRSVDQSR